MNYLFSLKGLCFYPLVCYFLRRLLSHLSYKDMMHWFPFFVSTFEFGTKTEPFIFIFLGSFLCFNECFYEKEGKGKIKYAKRLEKILKGTKKMWEKKGEKREAKQGVRKLWREEGSSLRDSVPSSLSNSFHFLSCPPASIFSPSVSACALQNSAELERLLCLSSQILFEWWNKIKSMHNCSCAV